MQEMIDRVWCQCSPTEKRKIKAGCMETAKWLVERILLNLTPTQVESVASRMIG